MAVDLHDLAVPYSTVLNTSRSDQLPWAEEHSTLPRLEAIDRDGAPPYKYHLGSIQRGPPRQHTQIP